MAQGKIDADRRGRSTGLDADQRKARASKAGSASQSISAYVRRIVRDAPQLSAEDLAALRQVVLPVTDADVYMAGMEAGAKLASDRLLEAVRELAAAS